MDYNFYTYLGLCFLVINAADGEVYHYDVSEWTPADVEEIMELRGIKVTQHIWEHIQDVLSKI